MHQRSRSEAWTFWAGCGAIRREVFAAMRGFEESYSRPCVEDIELGLRLRAAGHRIDLNRRIQVTHLKRWTFPSLVRTDVVDRGIPWLLLMLRARTMPTDLNITRTHRFSVALVCAMVLLCVGAVTGHLMPLRFSTALAPGTMLTALLVLAGGLFLLNFDLYRFFARKRGVPFAAGVVPLHWLYYGYCGLAVGVGLCMHVWSKLLPQRRLRWLAARW